MDSSALAGQRDRGLRMDKGKLSMEAGILSPCQKVTRCDRSRI